MSVSLTGVTSAHHGAWLMVETQNISIVVRAPEIYSLSKSLVLSVLLLTNRHHAVP